MNSQQLLYIYFGIGLFFVLYFLVFKGKPRQPTKLNLKNPARTETEIAQNDAERSEKVARVLEGQKGIGWEEASEKNSRTSDAEELNPARPVVQVRQVPEHAVNPPSVKKDARVFFVYNAHEWEAHEVLGIECGASLRHATEKYQHLIKTADPSTFEFYESAFQAILKKKGSR